MTMAKVIHQPAPSHPVPTQLYASVGFTPFAEVLSYRKVVR